MTHRALITIGILLFSLSQIIFGLVFYPIVSMEIGYRIKTFASGRSPQVPKVIPQNGEFKILIPKIDIRSEVLDNIDPFNKQEYTEALKKGVAQAKGTALPGEEGNIFIFAHSTDSPFSIANYNAVFYLANKLTAGDAIYLAYGGKYFKYIVEQTKIVGAKEINFLKSEGKEQILTLMTCWPPGTSLKRLLVIARLSV